MTVLVELCSGLAALTLHLHGRRPPASRIGCKQGYAAEIARELGLDGPPDRVVLVDADPAMCNAMRWLVRGPAQLAGVVEQFVNDPPREVWVEAKEWAEHPSLAGAAAWWLATASSYGGLAKKGFAGFRGPHKLRRSSDGFSPCRESLVRRIAAFEPMLHVEVVCADVRALTPSAFAANWPGQTTRVYIDPPYQGTQGYGLALDRADVLDVARRWDDRGCVVGVSEREPLCLYHQTCDHVQTATGCACGARHVRLTRRGQNRRSLTTSADEWLTVVNG